MLQHKNIDCWMKLKMKYQKDSDSLFELKHVFIKWHLLFAWMISSSSIESIVFNKKQDFKRYFLFRREIQICYDWFWELTRNITKYLTYSKGVDLQIYSEFSLHYQFKWIKIENLFYGCILLHDFDSFLQHHHKLFLHSNITSIWHGSME